MTGDSSKRRKIWNKLWRFVADDKTGQVSGIVVVLILILGWLLSLVLGRWVILAVLILCTVGFTVAAVTQRIRRGK